MIVHVLALGNSVNNFYKYRYSKKEEITIGINDISERFFPDHLFVCDAPQRFSAYRQERIQKTLFTHEQTFFSLSEAWKYIIKPEVNFQLIRTLQTTPENRGQLCLDFSQLYGFGFDSPFMAVQIAFKVFHAKKIILWGVDFQKHHLAVYFPLIKNLYKKLADELLLKDCKLYVCSEESRLSEVLKIYDGIHK